MGIGERLKEERERIGLSQTEFAAKAGASKNSQYNYEKGERSPDAAYLAAAGNGTCKLVVITQLFIGFFYFTFLQGIAHFR